MAWWNFKTDQTNEAAFKAKVKITCVLNTHDSVIGKRVLTSWEIRENRGFPDYIQIDGLIEPIGNYTFFGKMRLSFFFKIYSFLCIP